MSWYYAADQREMHAASRDGQAIAALLAGSPSTLAAQDARLIREARMLPINGDLTPEQIEFCRAKLEEYLKHKSIDIATVAPMMGYTAPVISQFLNRSYLGNNVKVARKANSIVEQLARGDQPGMPSGFVTTTQTDIIRGLAVKAQTHGKIAIYTGPSGAGKTMMAEAICAGSCVGITNAIHIRITAAHRSPAQFTRLLVRQVGSKPIGGSMALMLEGLLARLEGSNSLLIIDDAQRLDPRCDELILDLCKLARCPILILDTAAFDARSSDEGRWDGQFARNVVLRYNAVEEHEREGGTPLYTVEEVVRYCQQSMGLKLTGDAAEWLTELACFPGSGGLGRVTMLLLAAKMVMDKEQASRVTMPHLRAAWEANRGLQHFTKFDAARRAGSRKRRIA